MRMRRHRQGKSRARRVGVAFAAACLITVAGAVFAAAMGVPSTFAGQKVQATGANDLKPAACAGIDLANIVTGSGRIRGTGGNDLILGSSAADRITGGGGTDCMVGGGGSDTFRGNGLGAGDVCIAGPGGGSNPGGRRVHCDTMLP